MTFAKEVVTVSILNNRARFHRVRAERFGAQASRSQNPDSRAMYLQLAARGDCHGRATWAATAKASPAPSCHSKSPREIPFNK